jgi:hypothetical protein
MTETIIIAVISAATSGGVLAFLQFLITRQDARSGIGKKLDRLEKDGLRTQLLLLLLMQPEEQTEILTIAEHYFVKPPEGLGGNWYMTGLFSKWCDAHGIEPDWFKRD